MRSDRESFLFSRVRVNDLDWVIETSSLELPTNCTANFLPLGGRAAAGRAGNAQPRPGTAARATRSVAGTRVRWLSRT